VSEYGVFASVAPPAATVTPIYTIPAGRRSTGRVIITNRGAPTTIRLAIAPAGAADAPVQYMIWDEELGAPESIATAPITLNAGDVIRGYSASGQVNFHYDGINQS
jgi:hypothetical protein